MAFVGDASHQLGPARRVPTQHNKGGLHAARAQRIQNGRSGFGVGPVIERESERRLVSANVRNDMAEERTIWIQCTVREGDEDGGAKRGRNDHATSSSTCPSTERLKSSICEVKRCHVYVR